MAPSWLKEYKDFGIEVECLTASPLWLSANAIRYSHDNHHLSDSEHQYDAVDGMYEGTICGQKDKALIQRVGCKLKHESVLEMIDFTFSIHGISRALLLELSRHRIASLTVQSSRYVLHKLLRDEEPFAYAYVDDDGDPVISTAEGAFERAKKYIMFTGDSYIDGCNVMTLERLRKGVVKGISNDKLKYLMSECFRTKLQYKINARSLRNLLVLRTSKDALWEFRLLCRALLDAMPKEYLYLFEDVIKFEGNEKTEKVEGV